MMEVSITLSQNSYDQQCRPDCKIWPRSAAFPVFKEKGLVVSGNMTVKRRQIVCGYIFSEDVKLSEIIEIWKQINIFRFSSEEMQVQQILKSTINVRLQASCTNGRHRGVKQSQSY